MRKQCVNTSLRPRGIEQIFGLTVLLPHSVIGLHRNRAKRLPVESNAIVENDIVDAVSKNHQAREDKDCRKESASQSRCQRVLRNEHRANYKRAFSPLLVMVISI